MSEADRQAFDELNSRFNREKNRAYKSYAKQQGKKLIRDPKRECTSLPAEMSFGSQGSRSKKQIADFFATHFKTAFTDETSFSSEALNFSPTTLPAGEADLHQPFTLHEVRSVMKSLDVSKGAGPDDLPPSFWKRTALVLAEPLMMLFNLSLSSGCFPSVWKEAFVTAIHKSDLRSKVENYLYHGHRPLNLR